jgi:hypothetical protein
MAGQEKTRETKRRIFHKEKDEWKKSSYAASPGLIGNKVKGGIYTIREITETTAKFGRFQSTGRVCEDKEIEQMIIENEVNYLNEMQQKNAHSLMVKKEKTFIKYTLGELKDLAKKDRRFAYAIKQWVSNNL